MLMEQFGLLEQKIDEIMGRFARLQEEKNILERGLEEKSRLVRDLEREVGELREERDVVRERLGRLIETIGRLEAAEGGPDGQGA